MSTVFNKLFLFFKLGAWGGDVGWGNTLSMNLDKKNSKMPIRMLIMDSKGSGKLFNEVAGFGIVSVSHNKTIFKMFPCVLFQIVNVLILAKNEK